MSESDETLSIELVRWTFTVDPAHQAEISAHLVDRGLEVLVRGEDTLVATWDEPEGEIDEVIEELWAINGQPFEVIHEEFHRAELLVYHVEESDSESESGDESESEGDSKAVA